jgi:hypothetical protein
MNENLACSEVWYPTDMMELEGMGKYIKSENVKIKSVRQSLIEGHRGIE